MLALACTQPHVRSPALQKAETGNNLGSSVMGRPARKGRQCKEATSISTLFHVLYCGSFEMRFDDNGHDADNQGN